MLIHLYSKHEERGKTLFNASFLLKDRFFEILSAFCVESHSSETEIDKNIEKNPSQTSDVMDSSTTTNTILEKLYGCCQMEIFFLFYFIDGDK